MVIGFRLKAVVRMTFALAVAAAPFGCVSTLSPQQIEGASDQKLFEQMRWVNRGPDSAFDAGGRAAYVDELREEILKRHPSWPQKVVEAIREQQVQLRMTMPQVVAAIGWPREYPWWDTQFPPIGMDGDSFDYWSALQDANRWTYGHGDTSLRVWFYEGYVYRIMDQATGRIESTN